MPSVYRTVFEADVPASLGAAPIALLQRQYVPWRLKLIHTEPQADRKTHKRIECSLRNQQELS